jgi:hypothetical protein
MICVMTRSTIETRTWKKGGNQEGKSDKRPTESKALGREALGRAKFLFKEILKRTSFGDRQAKIRKEEKT